jgi:integrase
LQAVGGLKAGRSEAKESTPVQPVDNSLVEAVRPFVSRQVWTMIELQRLTGMRSGEVCQIRGIDLDRTGDVWTYTPTSHKTQHHGHSRIIHLGKQAQSIIRPFLRPEPAEYLFQPVDAENERHAARTAARKTPRSCGNGPGRKSNPKRTPGQRYTPEAYCHAIHKGCEKANEWARCGKVVGNDEVLVPHWHPHQLRHAVATQLRKRYGLEVAQVMLGHATLTAAQIYAAKNIELAAKVAGEVG